MTGWWAAGGWGLLAGSALLLGAAVGYLADIPRRIIASIMAFGAGVLLSAVAFELVGEAYERAGMGWAASGAIAGALIYTGCNVLLARRGARNRKRSGEQHRNSDGSGLALAFGALLDGIPESIVIGTSLLAGGGVSVATVAAVFVSNVPEGLSSAAGLRAAGRSRAYVFGLWSGIALISALSSIAGYTILAGAPATLLGWITALAGGAILTMVADTMIPEAFEDAHLLIGLIAVTGFLLSFALSHL
jgi:ZIP family zinc transporter